MLNSNSLASMSNGDSQFDQDTLSRTHSFRDNFPLFVNGNFAAAAATPNALNNLNLSNLNNQNNQSNQNSHALNVADLASNYGLDLACDLNSVIGSTSSLLSQQQKSAALNSASAYGQLLQRFYNQQSIYNLFNANSSSSSISTVASSGNSSFGSSSLKSRFASNPQLYSNLPNIFNKFDSKADRNGQEATSKCNSPNQDEKLESRR